MKGDVFNDNLLQEKAKELHKKFGSSTNFTASRGWLWHFKKRYNLNDSDIQKNQKKTKVDEFTIEKLTKLLNEENINEKNVYNIYKTTLIWKFLPQIILSNEEESVQNEKTNEDYVT